MTAFEQLHPALQHHIVNSLGWPRLRPLQEAAIEPVLRGEHAIMLAPTAGGKTEAACFPLFSRMLSENWAGLSVLYLCPIKALLNNLLPRLEYYAGLLGRRVAIWHGDISASRKAAIRADPPDILLTTPESLEAMLVSPRIDHVRFLGNMRAVVIDEVHAFAGDDRGWHVLALLERLQKICRREIQRLGLSATVGNPDTLCDWLACGCTAPRQVINPPSVGTQESDVQLDWVGTLQNAAIVVSRLYRGEKRLVFVDSRARVEELALELRALRVQTFVSHSSLSLEERRAAEAAFAEGSDCVIVATSTLELGIDVGDLDRVVQIDAPVTVSSFLQRIGRTGRRTNTSRNCLFLATKEDSFLRALGLLHLWRKGFVEPVTPPALPLHVYAQQIMALCLQEKMLVVDDLDTWLGNMPGFAAILPEIRVQVIQYMLATGILHADQGVLGIGDKGERTFGYQNFMDMLSVFTTPPMVKVFFGKQELGEVHELTFAIGEGGPLLLTLGGRSWLTTHVDWPRKRAYVEPTDMKGRSQWLGAGQTLHLEMCQAIEKVLSSEDPVEGLSARAKRLLADIRGEFGWLEDGRSTLLIDQNKNATWWTFCGSVFNSAIVDLLSGLAERISFDNLAITFSKVYDPTVLRKEINEVCESIEPADLTVPVDADFIRELKFSECLDQQMLDMEIRGRYSIQKQLVVIKNKDVNMINHQV